MGGQGDNSAGQGGQDEQGQQSIRPLTLGLFKQDQGHRGPDDQNQQGDHDFEGHRRQASFW